jgi:hypothetical protein
MKKIAIVILVSLSALAATHVNAGCKMPAPYLGYSIPTYSDSSKPKVRCPKCDTSQTVTSIPVADSTHKAQDPVFILQGSFQDFQALRNALFTLAFYAKSGSPDAKQVELVEWIDRQLVYQVQKLQAPPDIPKKK